MRLGRLFHGGDEGCEEEKLSPFFRQFDTL